jgi:hypothetical protein
LASSVTAFGLHPIDGRSELSLLPLQATFASLPDTPIKVRDFRVR